MHEAAISIRAHIVYQCLLSDQLRIELDSAVRGIRVCECKQSPAFGDEVLGARLGQRRVGTDIQCRRVGAARDRPVASRETVDEHDRRHGPWGRWECR